MEVCVDVKSSRGNGRAAGCQEKAVRTGVGVFEEADRFGKDCDEDRGRLPRRLPSVLMP